MWRKIQLFLILSLIFTLSGCWDLMEVDRRAFATTIGIDIDAQKNVILSVQVPLPQKMLSSGSTTGATGRGQPGKNFNTISIVAKTVLSAFKELQTNTYRSLVIQQNKSVIIGEEAARSGVKPLMDFLLRSPSAPSQSLVFIARGKTAQEVLSLSPTQQTLPGIEFIQSAQSVEKYDRTYYIPFWQFVQKLVHKTKDTYAPLITFNKEGQYVQAGLAVFNGNYLAGELSTEETQIFGIIANLMRAGTMTFDLSNGGTISLRNISGKTKIKVLLKDKSPSFQVQTNVAGTIDELTNVNTNITPLSIHRLERKMVEIVQPKIEATIKKLQQLNADTIDFGEKLRAQHQDVWGRLNWKKVFPTVPFTVTVKVRIQGNGTLLQ